MPGWTKACATTPSLEAARHTLDAVHQQYRAQVGDTLLPSMDAQGQASRQRALGLPNLGPPTSLYNVYAGQLSLNYDFDLFGAARYGVKRAAAQVDVQAYQLAARAAGGGGEYRDRGDPGRRRGRAGRGGRPSVGAGEHPGGAGGEDLCARRGLAR